MTCLIHAYIDSVPSVICIPIQSGLWGAPPAWSRQLVTYTCPSGYCDCSQGFDGEENVGCLLNYTNPNEICSDTRMGTSILYTVEHNICVSNVYLLGLLCGQCKETYGVGLLTNECKQFPDRLPQFWIFPIYCNTLSLQVQS